MALSEGRLLTFELAKSKPRVRDGTHVHGNSARMKEVESSRKAAAVKKLQADNPGLTSYGTKDFEVRPEDHIAHPGQSLTGWAHVFTFLCCCLLSQPTKTFTAHQSCCVNPSCPSLPARVGESRTGWAHVFRFICCSLLEQLCAALSVQRHCMTDRSLPCLLTCLQTAWQEHKSQLGREAGQDASLLKMSSGFREATAAHFRTYAAVTLEELAVETGAAEDHLTPDILEAFRKLRHSIVCSLILFPLATKRVNV